MQLKSRIKLFQVGAVIEWSGVIGILTEAGIDSINKTIVFSINWINEQELQLQPNERLKVSATLGELDSSANIAPDLYQVLYGR